MPPRSRRSAHMVVVLLSISLVLATRPAACATGSAASVNTLGVYDDQLINGFEDWSWTTRNLAATTPVHSGTHSISMSVTNWGGLYFHCGTAVINTTSLDTLQMWVRGGGASGQLINLSLDFSGSPIGGVSLENYIAGGSIPANSWAKVVVPLTALAPANTYYDGIILQARGANDQGTAYFDDLVLYGGAPAGPPVTLTVAIDPALDRHPVNPLIYGVNFGTTQEFTDLPYPVRRWGGNATTRYSWQNDTSNRALDWFFMNVPSTIPDASKLPDGSSADLFMSETRTAHAEVLLTVPTIGWTPKDRTKRWGFSVTKYGAQTSTECTASGGAPWCTADAGNGISTSNNKLITGNDPHDTSAPIGPNFVAAWKEHITAKFGSAGSGGVKYFALDNEPMLWSGTQRDVHPAGVTYDELWGFTVAYASRLKSMDSQIKVLGPDCWGWCDYFYSGADDCKPGLDQAAHGGVPLLDWYLQQVKAYQGLTGTRLVDLLDIHYYPQGGTYNDDESAGKAALRLRTVKSLYDSTYVDESWIAQPVKLIPRMKRLIADRAPGLGLAITEYNFGGDTGISSAIAQAEVLAIFGREGVDLATRWEAPQHGSRVQDAFRLYLNYDGSGSKIQGQSVRTTSSNVDLVGAYAVQDSSGRLYTLLFNKDLASQTVHVNIANTTIQGVQLYRFTGASPLAPAGTATPTGGSIDLVLPARSATLAVVDGSSATAALASLIQADSSPGLVRVRWELGQGNSAQVERRTLASDWQAVGMVDVDGTRQVTYEDRTVEAGTKYGYRLRLGTDGSAPTAGEVWVDVPGQYEFSLSGVQPNPMAGVGTLSLALPDGRSSVLEFYDAAGRRVSTRKLSLGPGRHLVAMDQGLAPGVYLVRLTHGGHALTSRAVVVGR
jgi:hypothetical protein